jgi:AraC-like DNA-binding protein
VPKGAALSSSVQVLWTARYDYQPHWKLQKHKHDYFQMIYFLQGTGRFFLQEHSYNLTKPVLFLIKPNQYHALNAMDHLKTLDVKFQVKDKLLRQSLLRSPSFVTEEDAEISHLFERIRWEGEHKLPLFRELCGSYLFQILILYLRGCGRPAQKDDVTGEQKNDQLVTDTVSRQVLDMIKSHRAQELDLQQIANSLGLSNRSVHRHFKETMGMPPMRYLLQYRVEKAKDLIRYSDYALKEIAELTGFKTIHHFTRVFREITGVPPAAWRRKYCQGICKDVCIDPHFSNVVMTVTNNSGNGNNS